jgi:protein-tyrosine-phosphatase
MNKTTKLPNVLFVCVHNSGRSQMAEAFFNRLAKGKAHALSAGTEPVDAVDPTVVEAMQEVGIDIRGNRPKALTFQMVEQADVVVTMGCEVEGVCPATFVETEEWELEDPRGKPLPEVRRIRDEIRARVVDLLGKIERKNGSQRRGQI